MGDICAVFPSCHDGSGLSVLIQSHLIRLNPCLIELIHAIHTGSNSCGVLQYCGNSNSSKCLRCCFSEVGRSWRSLEPANVHLAITSPRNDSLANFNAKVGTLLGHITLGLF